MAYFDELMQRAITVRNNVAPSSNTAILVGGVLVSIVSALQLLLDTKQGTLTFDDEPTDGSTNPVTSDGIYEAIADAIASIDLSACEKIVNKVTSLSAQSTDVQYPTAKCVYDALQAIDLSACEKIVNKVTSLSAQSTDVQYPSAKCVYDSLQALANEYAAINHTHHYTDINQPAIVATAGAQGYTITTADYSHIITLTAATTLHLPTITAGTARIMRLTLIQDLTGGHGVTFDGGSAQVYNPYQVDLSQGLGGYRCWVTLWFDGAQWCYIATPYVLRSESQFDYTISGTSTGASVTITINGSTMNIPVNAGAWEYGYNGAVTSLSLAGDTGVTTIDFSLSDGLAGVTSLAGAFSGCSALQSIDFTDCDLSAIVDATNAFSGCSALTALTIPSGEWLPDLDLSATAIGYSAMADIIIGLHTYASGAHTVTFNATIWDALTQAQQQTISDAASAKGWTTNAVAVVYVIRGTSTNVNGSEALRIQFIQNGAQTPDAIISFSCEVDSGGNFEYSYSNKRIYAISGSVFYFGNTITSLEFSEDFAEATELQGMFLNKTALTSIDLSNATFAKLTNGRNMFTTTGLTSLSLPNATFESLTNGYQMINNCQSLLSLSLPNARFDNVVDAFAMFGNNSNLHTFTLKSGQTFASATNVGQLFYGLKYINTFDLSSATFALVTTANQMFFNCSGATSIDLSSANFALLQNASQMFAGCTALTSLDLSTQTFASVTTTNQMFFNLISVTNLNLDNALFNNVTNAQYMFNVLTALPTLSLPQATFEKVTNAQGMFSQYNNAAMTTISAPKATFESLATTANANFFNGNYGNSIINYTAKPLGVDNKAIGVSFAFSAPRLNYASYLSVANWLKDLTGSTAQTITISTTAWNALTAAEQSNIDTILSGKNWTRVLG